MNTLSVLLTFVTSICLTSCSSASKIDPRFPNSVTSHSIDLIPINAPTTLATIEFVDIGRREMPDKRRDLLFDDASYIFKLVFEDQTELEVWAHSDFSSQKEARRFIDLLIGPIGKLPNPMRATLDHLVLHKGNESAFAEHLGHFFVLYSQNIETRYLDNDLEETVFHESVHATLDYLVFNDPIWSRAQKLDSAFVTDYARKNPFKEDLAETALLAYSLYINRHGLPPDLTQWLETNIPNRLEYLTSLYDMMGIR